MSHRWTPAVAALALVMAATAASAARTDYVVTIQGMPGGTMTVERDDTACRVRIDYSYRDNGRGPDTREDYVCDAAHRVLSYRAVGTSTFGGTIQEEFRFADGRLRWTSPADSGDEPAAEGGVFVPLAPTPAYQAQLLRALLARPGFTAEAGGGAVLTAERLTQTSVDTPQGTVPVALYAMTGGDVSPWYLWLREDGDRPLFAIVDQGWSVTPRGAESSASRLLEQQQAAEVRRLGTLRARTAQPLPGLTLIRNVRWFDARAAALRGPSDVYLADGRIGAIIRPGAVQASPDQMIDGSGRTLLPGLIDMHAHIWPQDALMHLAGGVTTVRDMGNQNDALWALKQRIDAGEVAGPHIVPAGFIEGESPFSARLGVVAATLDDALRAVDGYAARGYRQVKLYNSMRPEWIRPVTERAHRHGMTVAGHVPAFMRAEDAVRAGYDELTHINQVMLNFFVTPSQDTRTLLRFTLVGDEARRVDLNGPAARRFLALMRARGTAIDPTLATFEAMYTHRDGERHPWLGEISDHLPVLWRRGLSTSEMSPTAPQLRRYRQSFERMVEFVGAMHRAGLTLVAGTDDTPGLSLHRELALYVRAGIPPLQVLQIATLNGARIAGVSSTTGSIERGKAADLVLVDGDPSVDIGTVRRASLVIQGRVAYAPAQLYQAIGMRPFAPAADIVRRAAAPPSPN